MKSNLRETGAGRGTQTKGIAAEVGFFAFKRAQKTGWDHGEEP